MKYIINKIEATKIVPVVVLHDADAATDLAEALLIGNLPCAEVTFRTEAALDAIKKIANFEEILLGAGTVLTVDQVKSAVDCGAQFIVSPGLNPKVVSYCLDKKIPIVPGVCNPTDIEMALDFGLEVLKFFPAEAMGGVNTLKAISAPYKDVKFMPTGGIGIHNIGDYLSLSNVIACGGSWMVKNELIKSGDFDMISSLAKVAVEATNKF